MALDIARRAERAAAHELGVAALNIIRSDYWISRRSSLLAGERLQQDIKRLDLAYLDRNRREHEMTRHVSLRLLDARAVLDLKTSGTCTFEIPEWLFDLDMPGHFMRRIKSVSLSIPCVVGPTTGVNCRLTLLRSDIRHSPSAVAPYPRQSDDDPRFNIFFSATESIVTSSGRDDSGLFETSLRDERYLPFENAGAVSRWRLELPSAQLQFDIDTISDVVMHVRYTARDGGASLMDAAKQSLPAAAKVVWPIERAGPLNVVVSCRSEFPAKWAAAKTGANATPPVTLTINVGDQFLPYWMRAVELSVVAVRGVNWTKRGEGQWEQSERTPRVPITGGRQIDLGPLGPEDDVLALLEVG
jgi:hypothetical protein